VTAMSYASLSFKRKLKKIKESKINIKSEKLNKRKEKLSVFKVFYNIETANSKVLIFIVASGTILIEYKLILIKRLLKLLC